MTGQERWLEITLRLPAGELGPLLRSLAGGAAEAGAPREDEAGAETSRAFRTERFEALRRREEEAVPPEGRRESAPPAEESDQEGPEAEPPAESAPGAVRRARGSRLDGAGPYLFRLEEGETGETDHGRSAASARLPERPEGSGTGSGAEARQLSDAWERDARRYDGAFPRY